MVSCVFGLYLIITYSLIGSLFTRFWFEGTVTCIMSSWRSMLNGSTGPAGAIVTGFTRTGWFRIVVSCAVIAVMEQNGQYSETVLKNTINSKDCTYLQCTHIRFEGCHVYFHTLLFLALTHLFNQRSPPSIF